jgi:hypothetical protein
MLDLVTFVFAAVPIVAGLVLVFFSFKERSRLAAAPVKADDRSTSPVTRAAASDRT